MKKCASCTKDLPDAALHCVFCGAKQPPAPATAGGMAKTVMGAYSASDMIDHLKQQGGAPPPHMPAAAPYRPSPAPSHQPPAYQPPPAPSGLAPATNANAATMFVPGGGPPPGAFGGGQQHGGHQGGHQQHGGQQHGGQQHGGQQHGGQQHGGQQGGHQAGAFGAGGGPAPAFGGHGPMSHPVGTSPSHASSVPLAAPPPPQPVAPIPSAAPPYLASQTAARAGRPIEPWKDALRMMMFIWGGLLLVAFAAPLTISPLMFNWDVIANQDGVGKLPPLIMAAVGILAIAIAGIPMSPVPRGIIAALLGLAGVLVPMFLVGMPPWQSLLPVAGLIILIPSLLVRNEYRDSSLPRILITVGVIATLLPLLLPVNGALPLVELFKAAINAPGSAKLLVILVLAQIAIVVLSLLAWMPSPASGGAKLFAWLLILAPVGIFVGFLVITGFISMIPDAPGAALAWIYSSAGGLAGGKGEMGMPLGYGFGVAYAVLIGYGLATVIGKKLE
ncbi:MAG: hypothetical protein M4D80_31735 [Myxococcota bacterium]|nr:hypothetical protein [Myxococcota bacterium]